MEIGVYARIATRQREDEGGVRLRVTGGTVAAPDKV